MHAFMIAGASSGSGKTTVSIGIMKALKNNGFKVKPFKVGPDYIDPMFHKSACGYTSNNLDSYMLNEETIKNIFNKNTNKNDVAVIEGVMGYYDGFNFTTKASSYDIRKILKLPVILVVSAKGMSLSLNALLSGYKNYRKDSNIIGVILNNINSKEHYLRLKQNIEMELKLNCFGYLTSIENCNIKSRHLGLIQSFEIDKIEKKIYNIANNINETIDLQDIIKHTSFHKKDVRLNQTKINNKKIKLAVAYDKAFSFYYEENFNFLKENQFELINFSPLEDKKIPDGVHGIYLGGGYPEVYAKKLSQNKKMINTIRDKLENNLPCFAECGGLMYLSSALITKDKKRFPMADFFNCEIEMTDKLQRFGYIEVEYKKAKTHAHEFHYSKIIEAKHNNFIYKYVINKSGKDKLWKCGLSKNNVIAGYPHIHFLSNIEFSKKIVELFTQ